MNGWLAASNRGSFKYLWGANVFQRSNEPPLSQNAVKYRAVADASTSLAALVAALVGRTIGAGAALPPEERRCASLAAKPDPMRLGAAFGATGGGAGAGAGAGAAAARVC